MSEETVERPRRGKGTKLDEAEFQEALKSFEEDWGLFSYPLPRVKVESV